MNSEQLVNKLLEADADEPEVNLDRISRDIYQKSDLPKPIRDDLKTVMRKLIWTEKALSALTRFSSIDERDEAVSKLSVCAHALDDYNYDFPAHDWVVADLQEATRLLVELLESDSYARPEDALVVRKVIKLLAKILD